MEEENWGLSILNNYRRVDSDQYDSCPSQSSVEETSSFFSITSQTRLNDAGVQTDRFEKDEHVQTNPVIRKEGCFQTEKIKTSEYSTQTEKIILNNIDIQTAKRCGKLKESQTDKICYEAGDAQTDETCIDEKYSQVILEKRTRQSLTDPLKVDKIVQKDKWLEDCYTQVEEKCLDCYESGSINSERRCVWCQVFFSLKDAESTFVHICKNRQNGCPYHHEECWMIHRHYGYFCSFDQENCKICNRRIETNRFHHLISYHCVELESVLSEYMATTKFTCPLIEKGQSRFFFRIRKLLFYIFIKHTKKGLNLNITTDTEKRCSNLLEINCIVSNACTDLVVRQLLSFDERFTADWRNCINVNDFKKFDKNVDVLLTIKIKDVCCCP